jgi:hypothetical protein
VTLTAFVTDLDRDETVLPEYGFENYLISSIGLFANSQTSTVFAPHSSEYPPVSVVVGRIRSHEIAGSNSPITSVADVAGLCPIESLRRVRL